MNKKLGMYTYTFEIIDVDHNIHREDVKACTVLEAFKIIVQNITDSAKIIELVSMTVYPE